MKPVLYLDVDGVLWVPVGTKLSDRLHTRGPALGLKDFMRFALDHYEVRWCTTWAISGVMSPVNLELLAEATDLPVELWLQVQPSLRWRDLKIEALDWSEIYAGRPFAWIEDGLLEEEEEFLYERNLLDCFYHTDVFEDRNALLKTWGKLIQSEVTWLNDFEKRLDLGKDETGLIRKLP